MSGRLAGKVAVITGTAQGQGRAAALRFASEGAKIVGCDLRVDEATETRDRVIAAGGEMVSVAPLDLMDEADVARLVATAEETFGGIDILYNNAAATRMGTAAEGSREDFEFTIDHEVTIVWLATKAALPALARDGGGVIINTASVSGMTGSGFVGNHPAMFAHAMGKAAVIRMTQVLAIELAPRNVRVNSISPGVIDTELTRGFLDDAMQRLWKETMLLERLGTPEDVAAAALFLASDEASFITGTNLVVDGGWSASGGAGRENPAVQRAIDNIMAQAG